MAPTNLNLKLDVSSLLYFMFYFSGIMQQINTLKYVQVKVAMLDSIVEPITVYIWESLGAPRFKNFEVFQKFYPQIFVWSQELHEEWYTLLLQISNWIIYSLATYSCTHNCETFLLSSYGWMLTVKIKKPW